MPSNEFEAPAPGAPVATPPSPGLPPMSAVEPPLLASELPTMSAVPPPSLPPGPPPLPGSPPPGPSRHPVEFTGRAGEYFGIWIVNVVLSVLTLGIYSAWAKVRTQRWFYGHTRIAGSPFEYLAEPIAILKGRLVAYAFTIVLGLSAHFQLLALYIPLLMLLLLLLPFLLQRTLRFRARYSAWRGLRFRFVNGVDDAYINFMFRPILLIPTMYLLLPWVRLKQQDYMVTGHRFGGLRFQFRAELGPYYTPFLIALGLGAAAYLALVVVMVVSIAATQAAGVRGDAGDGSWQGMLPVVVPIVLVYLALLAIPVFLRTRYINLMWKNTTLGQHRFACTLRARDVIWLYLSNGIAIVATIGLAVPWAMVRMARYRAAHFTLLAMGDLDHFVAEAERAEGAAGAELVDALDLDMDISL